MPEKGAASFPRLSLPVFGHFSRPICPRGSLFPSPRFSFPSFCHYTFRHRSSQVHKRGLPASFFRPMSIRTYLSCFPPRSDGACVMHGLSFPAIRFRHFAPDPITYRRESSLKNTDKSIPTGVAQAFALDGIGEKRLYLIYGKGEAARLPLFRFSRM